MSRAALAAMFIVIGSSHIATTFAQTFWTAGTGDWNTASNWSLGVPDAGGGTAFDAVIENGGTAQLLGLPAGSVRRLRVGRTAGGGHLVVDGVPLTVTENLHLNETSSAPASVTVQNGATVSSPSTIVGYSSTPNTDFTITGAGTTFNAATQFIVGNSGAGTASLTVDAGAVLTSGTGWVGNGSGATGVALVRNPGSTWSTATTLTVGNTGTGTLTIEDQGVVFVGTALGINSASTVNLNGGTLRFNTVGGAGGLSRLNYTAGTIQLAGNREMLFDTTILAIYGSSPVIPTGKELIVEGTTTVHQDKTLSVNGGSFISQGLLTVGAMNSGSGTLLVSLAGTAQAKSGAVVDQFGFVRVNGAGSSWNVTGNLNIASVTRGDLVIDNQGSVYVTGALTLGFSSHFTLNGGTIRFNGYSRTIPSSLFFYPAGTVQLAGDRTIGGDAAIQDFFGAAPNIPTGKALVVEGTALLTSTTPVILSGGTLGADTLLLSPASHLTTVQPSQVSGVVLALAGSVIDTTNQNLSLGDAAKVNGFYSNGTLRVGQSTVTLLDANDAVFDSAALVTLGSGGSPGTMDAANGLTLDFGGNILGTGTISTPNDIAKPLIVNGHITGDSVAQSITLPGYVKGVGTFDNVNFTGTFSPGLSPTILAVGNVALAPTSTLVMELGGTTPGGGYDQIRSSGALALGGTLQVSLINGFTPAAGESFNLFDWTGTSGTFATLALPALGSGLAWNTAQLYATGVLSVIGVGLPGDYNNNGVVDAADYVLWRKSPSSYGGSPAGYDTWRANFGRTAGSGASSALSVDTAVPEPTSCVLLLLAAFVVGGVHRLKNFLA